MAHVGTKSFAVRTLAAGAGIATAAVFSLTAAPAAHATAGLIDVHVESGGTPVAGAVITVTKVGQPSEMKFASGSGDASFDGLAPGDWEVTAAKPGYAAATGTADATNVGNANLNLTQSASNFRSTPVFGAQGSAVAAGGIGEFYASTSVIPQLFRTTDYGGTWLPVNVGFDDATNGLPSTGTVGDLTTSGSPGEVAVVLGNRVRYSTDFGNTWSAIALTNDNKPEFGGGNGVRIWWGHQGSTSTLLARGSDNNTYVADMNDANPTFAAKAYSSNGADKIQVASGSSKPWVAVASGSTIRTYPLDIDPIAVPLTLNAADTVDCLAIGGTPSVDPNEPPTALYWSTGGGTPEASLSFQAAGIYQAAADTIAEVGGDGRTACTTNDRSEITRNSTSTETRLHVGGYFARYASGALLAAPGPSGAYSAGYDFTPSIDAAGSPDNVFIHPQGDVGFAKSSAFKTAGGAGEDQSPAYVPYTLGPNNASGAYPRNVYDTALGGTQATNGTKRYSGGGSVNGINVAVTKDIAAFAGTGTDKASVMLSMSGGGRGLVTDDGGATMYTAVKKGGTTTAYWNGAGGSDWLVYGHPDGSGIQYTLLKDWVNTDLPKSNGQQNSTIRDNVHGSMSGATDSPSGLAGIPKTNKMLGTTADSSSGGIFRAALSGDKGSEDAAVEDSQPFTAKANAVAYCPTGGTVNSLDDTAFVALGDDNNDGAGIKRIANASSGPLAAGTDVTGIPTGKGAVVDIDVNCDTGVIAAAGKDGVFVSQDAGATWLDINITTGGGSFSAIAIQKAGAAGVADTKIVAARGSEGFTFQSSNGGTDWVTVNDPTNPAIGGRNFTSEGISAIEFPGNAAAAALSQSARSGKVVRAASNVGALSLDNESSLAGSGSGTAALSASATGANAGGVRTGGGGGGGTPPAGPGAPAKQSQTVAIGAALKIKKGKTAKLPATTNQGQAISWKSSKAGVCQVLKGPKVKGKKKGSCILTATAAGTGSLNALSQKVSVKVK